MNIVMLIPSYSHPSYHAHRILSHPNNEYYVLCWRTCVLVYNLLPKGYPHDCYIPLGTTFISGLAFNRQNILAAMRQMS